MLEVALSNALVATVIAVVASVLSVRRVHPTLIHGAWLLVFVKLLTPPLFSIPVAFLEPAACPIAPAAIPIPADEASLTKRRAQATRPLGADFDTSPVRSGDLASRLEPNTEDSISSEIGTEDLVGTDMAGGGASERPVAKPTPELASATEASDRIAPSFRTLATAMWLIGSFIWFALAVSPARRIHRLIAFARPAPQELQEELERLARQFRLNKCPDIRIVSGVISPMVWAVLCRPRILIPSQLFKRLSPDERRTVLAHELAHIKRRDTWVRFLEFGVSGLYWWFPLVWWARVRLRQAEEECCDALVVSTIAASQYTYATALLKTLELVAEFSQRRPAFHTFGSGAGTIRSLERRLTMIYRCDKSLRAGRTGYFCLALLAAISLPFAFGRPSVAGTENAQSTQEDATERAETGVLQGRASESVDAIATKPFCLREPFEKKLALEWEHLRPDETHVSLDKNPGSLTITTQPGSIYGHEMETGPGVRPKNIFLVANPAGNADFVVTVCLVGFHPQVPYQQAGLLVYDDDDNYLKWVLERARYAPSFTLMRETKREALGDWNGVTNPACFERVWLRLTKTGDLYRYAYSTDGEVFTVLGTKSWGDGSPSRIGIIAKNAQAVEEIDAVFDSFELRAPTSDDDSRSALAALQELQGTWDAVTVQAEGQQVDNMQLALFSFEGADLVVTEVGRPTRIPCRVTVREGHNELTLESEIFGKDSSLFYRLEDDTLLLCIPGKGKLPQPDDWKGGAKLLLKLRRTPATVVAGIRRNTGATQKRFYRLDTDQDNKVTIEEFQADWPTPEAKRRAAEVFAALDRNSDERITYDEFRTRNRQAEFGYFDTDLDGRISLMEFGVGEMSYASATQVKRAFAALDRDDDNSLSFEEYDGKTDEWWFVKLDVNEDGRMSLSEYSARNSRLVNNGTVQQVFSAMDRDGDETLSVDEFANKPVEAVFGMLDFDASNELDLQEFTFWKRTPKEIEDAKREFAERDGDKSAGLSFREYTYREQDAPFWNADTNHDSQLSRVEFDRSEFGRTVTDAQLVFRTLDKDHNNVISLTEFREYTGPDWPKSKGT